MNAAQMKESAAKEEKGKTAPLLAVDGKADTQNFRMPKC
jgi:hypothetical protein